MMLVPFFITDNSELVKKMSAWRPSNDYHKWVAFLTKGRLTVSIAAEADDDIYHADIYRQHCEIMRSLLSYQPAWLNMDSRVGGYYDVATGKSLIKEINDSHFQISDESLQKAELVVLGGGRIEWREQQIVVFNSSATFGLPAPLQRLLNVKVALLLSEYIPEIVLPTDIAILEQCCNDLGEGSCSDGVLRVANKQLAADRDVILKMFDGQKWSDGSGYYARNVYLFFKARSIISADQLKDLIGGQYLDGSYQPSGPDNIFELLKCLSNSGQAKIIVDQPGIMGIEIKSETFFDFSQNLSGVSSVSTDQVIDFLKSLDTQKK